MMLVERVGHLRPEIAHPRRLLEEDLRQHGHEVLAGEGRRARERLEEHAAEREHVQSRADLLRAPRLLGRHVAERAEDRPRLRGDHLVEAGDAEVEELDLLHAAADEEEVRRLEIAVDDAARVHHAERLRHPAGERDGLVHVEAPVREAPGQVLPFEPLHGEELLARLDDAVVDVADEAGVAQLRDGLGLALEARVRGPRAIEADLHRHHLAREAVVGAEDLAHAPYPRELLELVPVPDDVAGSHGADEAIRAPGLRGSDSEPGRHRAPEARAEPHRR